MKKKIFLILIILLITTGCNAEYNLNISNNNYDERILLNLNGLNNKDIYIRDWKISTDIDEYRLEQDGGSNYEIQKGPYKFVNNNNYLIFSNSFVQNDYSNSTAVWSCYSKFTMINRNDNIILSTSQKNICYEKYTHLENLTINITVDKKVISHNADRVNGNTYTWNINRSNYNKKGINLVIDDSIENNSQQIIPSSNTTNNVDNNVMATNNDYIMYIFAGIILVIFMLGYLIYNKMKNKEDDI